MRETEREREPTSILQSAYPRESRDVFSTRSHKNRVVCMYGGLSYMGTARGVLFVRGFGGGRGYRKNERKPPDACEVTQSLTFHSIVGSHQQHVRVAHLFLDSGMRIESPSDLGLPIPTNLLLL